MIKMPAKDEYIKLRNYERKMLMESLISLLSYTLVKRLFTILLIVWSKKASTAVK